MKYVTEMGSGAVIYIPNFLNIRLGFKKLINGEAQTELHVLLHV
jgi:hypothetical protein